MPSMVTAAMAASAGVTATAAVAAVVMDSMPPLVAVAAPGVGTADTVLRLVLPDGIPGVATAGVLDEAWAGVVAEVVVAASTGWFQDQYAASTVWTQGLVRTSEVGSV